MKNPQPVGSGRSGQANKPQSPKIILRAYPDVSIGANNTYLLFVEVNAFQSGQPMAGQEVVLKEKTSMLDKQNLDNDGEVMLRSSGPMADVEQIKTFRVGLTGLAEEKTVTVTIPAIKKIVYRPKAISVVPANVVVDKSAGTYSASFLVSVFEDGKPVRDQMVACKEGIAKLGEDLTDNNGQVTFNVSGNLGKNEKNVIYRFFLVGLPDNVAENMTVPATDVKNVDNDPETMTLRRYHDGNGNFKVHIRVLKIGGVGLKNAKVKIWYQGCLSSIQTDDEGEAIFNVPGPVAYNTSEHLTATISGIADEASVDIKRRKQANPIPAFTKRWGLRTNNGRAFTLFIAVLATWIVTFIVGVCEPKVNRNMFNHGKSGLSTAEEFFNESARLVDNTYVVEPHGDWSTGQMAYWGWLIIITALIILYNIFAWREEIKAWIEDKLDKFFDKSHSKAGDPLFETLAKMLGSYRVAKKTPVIVQNINSAPITPSSGATPNPNDAGHASLGTLFSLDLISDTLVSLVSGLFKKLFNR